MQTVDAHKYVQTRVIKHFFLQQTHLYRNTFLSSLLVELSTDGTLLSFNNFAIQHTADEKTFDISSILQTEHYTPENKLFTGTEKALFKSGCSAL